MSSGCRLRRGTKRTLALEFSLDIRWCPRKKGYSRMKRPKQRRRGMRCRAESGTERCRTLQPICDICMVQPERAVANERLPRNHPDRKRPPWCRVLIARVFGVPLASIRVPFAEPASQIERSRVSHHTGVRPRLNARKKPIRRRLFAAESGPTVVLTAQEEAILISLINALPEDLRNDVRAMLLPKKRSEGTRSKPQRKVRT